jgi:small multidrug resistance pump
VKWLVLILGITCNASASLLIKLAMIPPRQFPSFSDPIRSFSNWPFWLGLILYGAAFLLYAAALSFFPLNVAHPILTSGAIATVAVLSTLVLGESFNSSMVFGLICIVAGVILITNRVQ